MWARFRISKTQGSETKVPLSQGDLASLFNVEIPLIPARGLKHCNVLPLPARRARVRLSRWLCAGGLLGDRGCCPSLTLHVGQSHDELFDRSPQGFDPPENGCQICVGQKRRGRRAIGVVLAPPTRRWGRHASWPSFGGGAPRGLRLPGSTYATPLFEAPAADGLHSVDEVSLVSFR